MHEAILTANGLTKKYGDFTAINNVSFSVNKGDIFGLIGRNGAGKTTLLKMISGLTDATGGEFSIFSKTGDDLRKERRRIGCLIEEPAFFRNMTVEQNLKYYCLQKGITDTAQIKNVINTIGLKQYGEALGYAEKLINKEGENNSGDLGYYGQALAGNQRYAEAISKYEKALSVDPTNIMPYKYISDAYNDMGQEDKALEYSAMYLDKNPNAKLSDYRDIADIYANKIKKAKEAGNTADVDANFAKVVGVYDQVIAKYPQAKVWGTYQKANTAFSAELDDKATPYFQEVVSLLENNSDRSENENYYLGRSYSLIGYYYWTKNELDTAGQYFDKCVKVTPDDNIAKTWFQKKAEAEAAPSGEATE